MVGKVCPGHDVGRLQRFFQRILYLFLSLFLWRRGGDSTTTTTVILHIPWGGTGFCDVLRTSLELHHGTKLCLVGVDFGDEEVGNEEEDAESDENAVVPPRVAPEVIER